VTGKPAFLNHTEKLGGEETSPFPFCSEKFQRELLMCLQNEFSFVDGSVKISIRGESVLAFFLNFFPYFFLNTCQEIKITV
jgi:hypothetical protein